MNRTGTAWLRLALLSPLLAAALCAFAADKSAVSPADDISPMEKHPECMDRTADAMSAKCLEQSKGTPRQKHPPKPATGEKTAPAPAAGDASTAAKAGKSRG